MSVPAKLIMRFVSRLGAIPFFPTDTDSRESVMDLIERMVSTPAQLDWLSQAVEDRMRQWEGPARLREIFCSRYLPADGRDPDRPGEDVRIMAREHLAELDRRAALGLPVPSSNMPALEAPLRLMLPGQVETVSADPEMQCLVVRTAERVGNMRPLAVDKMTEHDLEIRAKLEAMGL